MELESTPSPEPSVAPSTAPSLAPSKEQMKACSITKKHVLKLQELSREGYIHLRFNAEIRGDVLYGFTVKGMVMKMTRDGLKPTVKPIYHVAIKPVSEAFNEDQFNTWMGLFGTVEGALQGIVDALNSNVLQPVSQEEIAKYIEENAHLLKPQEGEIRIDADEPSATTPLPNDLF